MPEVLRVQIDDTAPRPLASPAAVLDPATTAEVERRIEQARASAYAEGERAGREAAHAQVARAVDAVERAAGQVSRELAAQREQVTRASLALAQQLATAVLDATPPVEASDLLRRVEQAAAGLDDERLTVALHPDDHAALSDVMPADARLELVADRSVAAGEARLAGPFGGAELTRTRLLAAAVTLAEEAGAG